MRRCKLKGACRVTWKLVVLLSAIGPFASGAPSYSLVDLGNVGGVTINNSGQVLGMTAVYTGGVATPLGVPVGATGFVPTSINDSGQVVGYGVVDLGGGNSTVHNYLWSNGSFSDLGTQQNPAATNYGPLPLAINNAGVIAMRSNDTPTLKNGAIVTPLSPSTFVQTAINGSNENVGATAGTFQVFAAPNTQLHAAVNDGVTTSNLPDGGLIYPYSLATAVNPSGHVVGYIYNIYTATKTPYRQPEAAEWVNGVLSPLGVLSGQPGIIQGPITEAHAINASDQIVGLAASEPTFFVAAQKSAFLYSAGQLYDLNSLIASGSGFVLQDGVGINDIGQILVNGVDSASQPHSFLLTPVPEPGQFFALILAVSGFLVRRRHFGHLS